MNDRKTENKFSSNDFKEVYDSLGIRISDLGCVMLDLSPSMDIIRIGKKLKEEDCLYYAKDKSHYWINGFTAGEVPHVTLLYGLLGTGEDYKKHIETVLDGWKIKEIEIEKIGYFPSPFPEEPYKCIVAHVKQTPDLLEGHHRLELLPHINTYTFKPHFTLAYIKKDYVGIDCIREFSFLEGKKIDVNPKLNLGGI